GGLSGRRRTGRPRPCWRRRFSWRPYPGSRGQARLPRPKRSRAASRPKRLPPKRASSITFEITFSPADRCSFPSSTAKSSRSRLGGWEGKPAQEFTLTGLDGHDVASAGLRHKVVLLYVWFTGCPPCMKETPELVKLEREFRDRGFTVVGANSDRLLGLGYDDQDRERYARKQGINFPVVHWTKESDAAYGRIAIFPTLFLIDGKGGIVRHWVGFVEAEEL